MSQPFIFIGTHRLKEGKLEAAKQLAAGLTQLVEPNEPRVIGFDVYCNEGGTEVSVVQIHPDADSMLFHMQLLREHISSASDDESPLDVTTNVQVYGTLGDDVLAMIRQFNPEGTPLIVKPRPLGGFVRSAAEQAVTS